MCVCVYLVIHVKTVGKYFVYYHFGVNILRWCPFVYLFDTPFQNPPYGH